MATGESMRSNSVKFGERLDALMSERGESNSEVGAAIGVSGQSVGKWRHGGKIDDENLKALAKYLGVNWLWLRYGDEAIEEIQRGGTDVLSRSRKRWIEEAMISERRHRQVCEMLGVGVWEADVINDTLWWSSTVFRLFEVDPDNFKGRSDDFYSRVPEGEHDLIRQAFVDHIDGRTPIYSVEHSIVLPDGRTKRVRELGQRQAEAGARASVMLGVVWDVASSETTGFMCETNY